MSLNEWLVIGAGLLIGWGAVSFLFRTGGPAPRQKWEEVADAVMDGEAGNVDWWVLLGVSANANRAEVQAAYECLINQAGANAPAVETAPESARREQRLALLTDAYEEGLASAPDVSE
jgi:hypothetical protein